MADNSTLPASGDVIRDKDRTGVKTQIVALDLNPAGVETLMAGTMPVLAASLPLPAGAAADGTDATGVTMPTGGVGIRGWLSSIFNKLNTSIAVTGTFFQATQPISATQLPAALAAGGGMKVEGVAGGVAQPVSGTVSATQGTAAAIAAAWPVKVTDGTTTAKVTVANAQPASTDGAVLVNAIDTFAGTAFASASRAVNTFTFDILNYNGKGIRVWQDLTVLGASSVVTFKVQEKDPVSGKFIDILASAATGPGINATGTAKLTVYPGLTAAANSIASDVLPVNIRISVTVATAASTFSVGYSLIP